MTPQSPRDDVTALIAGTPLANEVEFLAVKAFAKGTRLVNTELKAFGLRARTYSVLALACSGLALTQRDLGTVLELDPSQIVGLVDELELGGLVERMTSPDDHRVNAVRATAEGAALFARTQEVTAASEAESLAMLSLDERASLRALLRKITFSGDSVAPSEPLGGDTTLLYLIKQVELAVRSQLDAIAATRGLTALQYTALTVLERREGMTSSALARASFVRPQTMAQMVASLDALGFISRQRDPRSQRQILISLTERGQRVLGELRRPVADLESTMVGELGDGQIAALRHALTVCRRALGEPTL